VARRVRPIGVVVAATTTAAPHLSVVAVTCQPAPTLATCLPSPQHNTFLDHAIAVTIAVVACPAAPFSMGSFSNTER